MLKLRLRIRLRQRRIMYDFVIIGSGFMYFVKVHFQKWSDNHPTGWLFKAKAKAKAKAEEKYV